MPNIRQYETPVGQSDIRPSEEGPSAFERVGRTEQYAGEAAGRAISQGVNDLGRTVGEIGKQYEVHATTQQFLSGMQQSAQRQAQFEDEKAQALASPDPEAAMRTTVSKFNEDLNTIGSTFTTPEGQRMWAEHQATAYTQALTHGMADAYTAVGDKIIQNIEATQHDFVNLTDKNPHMLASTLDQVDQMYAAAKMNLTAKQQTYMDEQHATVRNQLGLVAVNSAAKSFFQNNPNATPDQFPMGDLATDSAGNSVLSAEGLLHAQAVIHSAWQEQKTLHLEQSENAAGQAEINAYRNGTYDPALGFRAAGQVQSLVASGQMDARTGASVLRSLQSMHNEVVDQQDRSIEFQRSGIRFGQEQQDRESRLPATEDNQAVMGDLDKKIAGGLMPPSEVRELYNNKQITTETYRRSYGDAEMTYQKPGSLSMFTTPAYKGELKRVDAAILHTAGDTPGPAVSAMQGLAERDLGVAMGRAKAAGIDPQSLLDPGGPNYWPTPDRMKAYAVTAPGAADALFNKTTVAPTGPVRPPAAILEDIIKKMGPPAGAPHPMPSTFGG
ncbi:MAG: hypothetical protein ACLPKW_07145 [Acetobacteraceae bacterium]